MELKILPDGDIRHPPGVAPGLLGEGAELVRDQQAVGDPDAHHEAGDGPSHGALPVALGVQPPPPKAQVEVVLRDGPKALPGIPEQVGQHLPGTTFALDPLGALRFGFLHRSVHERPPSVLNAYGGRRTRTSRSRRSKLQRLRDTDTPREHPPS